MPLPAHPTRHQFPCGSFLIIPVDLLVPHGPNSNANSLPFLDCNNFLDYYPAPLTPPFCTVRRLPRIVSKICDIGRLNAKLHPNTTFYTFEQI